jgi:hypothetical protein
MTYFKLQSAIRVAGLVCVLMGIVCSLGRSDDFGEFTKPGDIELNDNSREPTIRRPLKTRRPVFCR